MNYTLETDVKALYGVGEAKAKLLNKLGITDLAGLLYHFPRAYEYRGNIKTLASSQDGETAAFILTIASAPTLKRLQSGKTLIRLLAFDGTGQCSLAFFNQTYIQRTVVMNAEYRVYGKVSRRGRFIDISSPAVEPYSDSLLPLYPVYPATEGMSSAKLQYLIFSVLTAAEKSGLIVENLPERVVSENGLMSRARALSVIHRPPSFDALAQAKRRLIFEEIYAFALELKRRRAGDESIRAVGTKPCDAAPFKALLTFEPTGAQKRTMNEIYTDMTQRKTPERPMRRIVCGDVGSGKTLCAQFAAYICAKSGFQTAFMAPTEILARQHYADLQPFFEKLGIKVGLLIGELKPSEKNAVKKSLREGTCDIVVGTHALLSDNVEFARLGLVVCDEQHRFGVNQRNLLLGKGQGAHMLVMSATPIPRTLALAMFGDLDVSVIDELPPGRQAVATFALGEDKRDRVNALIEKEVRAGHQAFIVCPNVEDSEDAEEGLLPLEELDLGFDPKLYEKETRERKAAVSYAEKLQKEVFPSFRVGYLHGKLKGAEKAEIMQRFAKGELDILVSTTVIEVGINVPNATLMIVEDADCFGLSQLHQLRGRVGRGKLKSYCILMSSSPGQVARERLELMARTNNGFEIAEYDLKQRGPGDFFKDKDSIIRQHGELKLRLAGMLDDAQLLYRAFEAADKL